MRTIKAIVVSIYFVTITLLSTGAALAQVNDSLDIKIGQMILIGFGGAKVDKEVLREVSEGKAGSIIIFEKNIPRENSYIELKKMLWTYQKAAPIPLFISIDQEGGRVNRLKEKYGFPKSLSAADLGKSVEDTVRFYSQMTAATLAGLGINVNLAPVVDLANNPTNPIIAGVERAFSANPDSVTKFARMFIEEHRKFGVINVLKHFPGHGSSRGDTHLGMADVSETWEKAELKPYQELIKTADVDAVMTAHIINTNLDKNSLPGTLSNDIINGLLRKQLGFQGVVFSDDMQMLAIAKYYGLEEAIRMAINAGVDILCFSNNIQASESRTVDKVHEIIRKFVENGTISHERIDESYRRVIKLKSTLANSLTDRLTEIDAALREKAKTIGELQAELNQKDKRIKELENTGKQKKRKN